MKVDIDKLHLGHSELTDEIFVGTLTPTKTKWRNKINVTNMFLDCVIKRWEGQTEEVTCGSHSWEVTVKKIK